MTDTTPVADTQSSQPQPTETAPAEPVTSETPSEPDTSNVNPETLIPQMDYRTDPLFYAVADYFNVPQEEYAKAKEYLAEIVDHAIRETKSNNPVDIIEEISKVEREVQPPQWGEKRYWNIRKYVRLSKRKSEIERAQQAIARGDYAD